MTNRFDEIAKQRDKIRLKEAQRDVLMLELDRSIAIGQLWGEAFDGGGIRTQISGNPYSSLKLRITRPDGNFRRFDLRDIPFILWDEPVKIQIRECRGAGNLYWSTLQRHENVARSPEHPPGASRSTG